MMFGYACKETKSLMPLPIELAHELAKRLETVRRTGELPFLLPDGKSQVTVEYDGDRPVRIASVLVSAQHQEEVSTEAVRAEVRRHVMEAVLPAELLDENTQFYVNPTGRFVYGGPAADSGLTGRKLIVDTYGGYARHGGGAFSGKVPPRWIAAVHIWRATSPRISWHRIWPTNVKFSSAMPLVWRSPCRYALRHSERKKWTEVH